MIDVYEMRLQSIEDTQLQLENLVNFLARKTQDNSLSRDVLLDENSKRAQSNSLVGLGILKSNERLKANSSVIINFNPIKTPDTADVIGYDSPADQNLRIN
jgi:hypothetical protein